MGKAGFEISIVVTLSLVSRGIYMPFRLEKWTEAIGGQPGQVLEPTGTGFPNFQPTLSIWPTQLYAWRKKAAKATVPVK